MNNDLITLKNWLNMNKLSLNALKTKCMFIATPQMFRLGIWWGLDVGCPYCYKVISKVTQVNGILRRLKSFLPRQTLILIYIFLIQQHFDYCSSVWGNLIEPRVSSLDQTIVFGRVKLDPFRKKMISTFQNSNVQNN